MSLKLNLGTILVLITTFSAQAQTISICGVDISVGDEREIAESRIEDRCRVMRHPSIDMSFYYWDTSEPNKSSQGTLSFKNERVSYISLPPFVFRNSVDPVDLARAFATSLQDAFDASGAPHKISTIDYPFSAVKLRGIDIEFKDRRISILTKEGGATGGQDVSISTSISGK